MTKKHRIRIGIIVVIICMMSFSDRSFAEETTNKDLEFLGLSLNIIIGRMSRLWIIFAKIAGELLTNKWIYGETLGLDALFRKYRNVAKNFANFGLGFYFVYAIFKGLILSGKDSIENTLKNTLLWLLIAGIGIQSSWFLTATIIDVSSIVVSAVGSFPSLVMSENPYIETKVKESIRKAFYMEGDSVTKVKLIEVGEKAKKTQYVQFMNDYIELKEPKSMNEVVDILQPKPSDVSGPLYFIGFSILNIKDITSINSTSQNGWKATIFNTIIQGGATLIYGIEMLILCIVAIMRIIYLWLFIIISPIAILLRCIEASGEKIGGGKNGFLSGLLKQINLGTLLVNVFKPAIVVLGIGVAAMFAGLMSSIVANSENKDFTQNGVTYMSQNNGNYNTNTDGDIKYISSMDHNLFNISLINAGKTFLELVLSIVTVILVYIIIRTAMTMGNSKDSRIAKIQDTVGRALGSIPVIPVAGKEGTTNYIGADKIFGTNGKTSLLSDVFSHYDKNLSEINSKDADTIKKLFGDETGYLDSSEKTKIENAVRSTSASTGKEVLEAIKEALPSSSEGKGLTLAGNSDSSQFWIGQFTALLNKNLNFSDDGQNGLYWETMQKTWNGLGDDKKNLENLFNDKDNGSRNRKTYMKYFTGKERSGSRDQMKQYDISKKENPDVESQEDQSQKDQSQKNPPVTGGGTEGTGDGSQTGQSTTPTN